MKTQLKFKKLHPDAITPRYASTGAACFDLHVIHPQRKNIFTDDPVSYRTGLAFEVPEGHVLLVFSRSGHGFNHATRLANCVGVIDSDYRGELLVRLTRDGGQLAPLGIGHGDRIAQAMLVPIPVVELVESEDLSETQRSQNGFGSTGA